jgi:hypothetical protein
MTAGVTNVLNIDAATLAGISTLTFRSPTPGPDTPLLINVDTSALAGNFSWQIPNLSGIGNAQAPYMLWNFGSTSSLLITNNGATLEGTLYAPNTTVDYQSNSNLEGNVVAANFFYRQAPAPGIPREIHNFPFAAELTCETTTPTTATTTTTTATTTTTMTTTTTTAPTTTTQPATTTTSTEPTTTTTSNETTTTSNETTTTSIEATTTSSNLPGSTSLPDVTVGGIEGVTNDPGAGDTSPLPFTGRAVLGTLALGAAALAAGVALLEVARRRGAS